MNSVIIVNQPVWEMLGTGFFTEGEIGAGMSGLRDYNANSLGGGVQYSFSTDKIKVLLSGEYTHTVEDAGNHYTTPKTVGTTKENIWSASSICCGASTIIMRCRSTPSITTAASTESSMCRYSTTLTR